MQMVDETFTYVSFLVPTWCKGFSHGLIIDIYSKRIYGLIPCKEVSFVQG